MSAKPTQRLLRVFCPTHRIGFEAVAAGTILCGAGGHALAQNFPRDEFWEYCCDCQHFWPSDIAKSGKGREQCLVCDREIVRRFVCGDCKLISSESGDAVRRKAHSIAPGGAVDPSCPGCLSPPRGRPREHRCAEAGVSFVTPRADCPFCEERIGEPPSLPSSVANYLAQIKSGKTEAALDAARGLLVARPGGEFILLQNGGPGAGLAFVFPRAERFEARQDYYAYETLYHCAEVAAGEVWVLHPAVVEREGEGWRLRETGWLEIKGRAPAPPAADLATQPLGVASPPPAARVCPRCGTQSQAAHAFCRECGLSQTLPANAPAADFKPTAHDAPHDPPAHALAFEGAPTPGVLAETIPAEQGAAPGRGGRRVLAVVGVCAVLAAVFLIVVLALNTGGPTTASQLDKAIARGRLFAPPGESAYDLYRRMKSEGARPGELKVYEERLWPLLTSRPTQLLDDFASPSDNDPPLAEWEESSQLLSWASELRPDDGGVAARAAYCQGRIAYIAERKDEALTLWKRASELDKSWALATNGVGLIYNERREYEAARPFLREAIKRSPNWPLPYNNLGTSFYYKQRYDEARTQYEKAVELAPNWARPHAWLGDIAMYQKDYERAATEYGAVLDPAAVGASRMRLDQIRQKLEEARRLAEQQAAAADESDESDSGDMNGNMP